MDGWNKGVHSTKDTEFPHEPRDVFSNFRAYRSEAVESMCDPWGDVQSGASGQGKTWRLQSWRDVVPASVSHAESADWRFCQSQSQGGVGAGEGMPAPLRALRAAGLPTFPRGISCTAGVKHILPHGDFRRDDTLAIYSWGHGMDSPSNSQLYRSRSDGCGAKGLSLLVYPTETRPKQWQGRSILIGIFSSIVH